MGIVKFGGGVSAISGKVGGNVYARNRTGAYMRNWAKPTNPGTILQSVSRANLATAVSAWASLNNAQVTAWNAYASTMTRLNRLGDSYVPTGRQIYIECTINLALVGQAAPIFPGSTNLQPSVTAGIITNAVATSALFTALNANMTITFNGVDPVPANNWLVVYSAPAHQAQKQNMNKQRRLLMIDDAGALPIAAEAIWNLYFGATAIDGLMVDLWIKAIENETGLASNELKLTKVIT